MDAGKLCLGHQRRSIIAESPFALCVRTAISRIHSDLRNSYSWAESGPVETLCLESPTTCPQVSACPEPTSANEGVKLPPNSMCIYSATLQRLSMSSRHWNIVKISMYPGCIITANPAIGYLKVLALMTNQECLNYPFGISTTGLPTQHS